VATACPSYPFDLMDKVKVPTTPLVLSLILMPMLESAFRQSLGMAAGAQFYWSPGPWL
jgi:TctA family transporter